MATTFSSTRHLSARLSGGESRPAHPPFPRSPKAYPATPISLKSRAECATALLGELNEEVRGDFMAQTTTAVMETVPNFFERFTAVVVAELDEPALLQLAELLWQAHVPLLVSEVCGMFARLRLVVAEHAVVESHPDDPLPDLRVLEPFPALRAFVDAVDLDKLDSHKYAHVPFVVLLIKQLDKVRGRGLGGLLLVSQHHP